MDLEDAVAAVVGVRRIYALVESALELECAFQIAGSSVASIALGETDLKATLGIDYDEAFGRSCTERRRLGLWGA